VDTVAGIDLKRVHAILDHDDTVPDLRRYFGVGLPAQQVPPFTGGWFERVGLGGDRGDVANRITTDDLIAVETLSVRVPPRVALDLLHGELGEQFAAMLTHIPPAMTLANPGATEHVEPHSAADQAWHLLDDQVGVGWVTAGKLLARKRPHLIPVYDNVVRCGLGRNALGRRGTFWVDLHNALVSDNLALNSRLTDVAALAEIGPDVSVIRCLDVIIWMRHQDQHSNKGCPGIT
jgi:hypothetical protein